MRIFPIVATHRADVRRRGPWRALTVTLGGIAVVVAGAGALGVAPPHSRADAALSRDTLPHASHPRRLPISSLQGTDSVSPSDPQLRARVVSRDASRDARRTEANHELAKTVAMRARERTARLDQLAKSAQSEADRMAARKAAGRWYLPVTKGAYHLTAGFGQCSGLWSHCHTGLDFAAPSGTPIHAVSTGVVTEVGYEGAYGNRTIMRLTDGTVIWYCHQTSYDVTVGDQVRGGQVIGSVGSTGNTTGPHVHLEVHPHGGDPVDPFPALVAHGLKP